MAEHDEQVALFAWAELQKGYYPELGLMYAIPNQAVGGDLKTLAYYRQEGLKPGIPDICLPAARGGYFGLYIELKFGYNKTTKEQDAWIAALRLQGYKVEVCRGFDEAQELILEYLEDCFDVWG